MNKDTELARWLAGELNSEELEALKASPRYATLLRIKENFERLEKPQIKNLDMLEEILKAEKKPSKTISIYRKYWIPAVAASIIIAFSLGFLFTMPEDIVAGNGETYAFSLPDKSEVILNSGSQASYKDFNWPNNREINLEGEAYFKVAKGKTFSVKTSLGDVTVLGTQFNVKARNNRLDVVCYEGKVRVRFKNKETVLAAKQGISIQNNSAGSIIQSSAAEPQWLHGEIVFSDEEFSGVIAEIERHYNIAIKTDYQSSQAFSGSIPGNDLEGALKGIARTYHLNIEKRGTMIILTPIHGSK